MKWLPFVLGLFLAGCAVGVRPQHPGGADPGSVAAALSTLGTSLLWIGALATVVGVAGRFYAGTLPIPFAGGIATFIAASGACAVAFGICSIFVSDHPWVLYLTIGCVAAAFAVRYHDNFYAWLRLGKKPRPTIPPLKG